MFQNCMEDLESCHVILSLWLWLALRLDSWGQFPGQDTARAELAQVQVCGRNVPRITIVVI